MEFTAEKWKEKALGKRDGLLRDHNGGRNKVIHVMRVHPIPH